MKQRLLVAAVGLPLLLLVLLACPAWATLILVCFICAVAAYELLHTANPETPAAVYVLTIAVSVVQPVLLYFQEEWEICGTVSFVTVIRWSFLMLLFLAAVLSHEEESPHFAFHDLAAAVVGGIVFPALYSCLVLLRRADSGVLTLSTFAVAFIGDSFSMLFGKLFGRKKMSPKVSPHKTWAGFAGGVLGGALSLVLLGMFGRAVWNYEPDYTALVFCGAAANLFGQLGDLSMSLIKREAGIKDYSRLFLEHGGMLDRFDSTMFIAPVIYFFVAGGIL